MDHTIGEARAAALREEVELLGAGREFDLKAVRNGTLSPVFFGSALTNFGVEPFLEAFLRMTTPPLPRVSDQGEIDVFSEDFSAFVFKIQANMNKAHRDRLAFMRICSGKFRRETEYYHVQSGKKLRLSQPQQMMAQERHVVSEAYAGDIIGVFDPAFFPSEIPCALPERNLPLRDPHLRAGAFCKSAPARYDEEKTVRQGNFPDCTGRCDPDFPGVQRRHGGDHRRRCRRPAV